MNVAKRAVLVVCTVVLCGCESASYYAQSVGGHLSIMRKRAPIAELVRDESLPGALRERLSVAVDIREFAGRYLGLDDGGSYRTYVDLERRFVVWNVVAAPEFSLNPKTWCFPVVGCVSYRGYYSRERAQAYADTLAARGNLDIYVAGARAYSTLGWFDDPLLNTVVEQPLHYMASVIIHELAHQRLYVADDSAFNEAFAVAVEREGIRRWLETTQASEALRADYTQTQQRERQFIALVSAARNKLEALYAANLAEDAMRKRKAETYDVLLSDYERLKRTWQGYTGYDRWFYNDLNNAKLALVATYHRLVPAFQRLIAQSDGDMERFYTRCEELGSLPIEQRSNELEILLSGSKT